MIASYVAFRTRAVSPQNSPQDAQEGRSARPQRTKRRIVLVPYGEPLSDARTPLADFFRILLERLAGRPQIRHHARQPLLIDDSHAAGRNR